VTQTAQAFVTTFLTRCVRANTEVQPPLSAVPQLDLSRLLPRYKHSHRRLLLLDFEGAVWQRDLSRAALTSSVFAPPREVLELLNRLAEDRRNEVWLLSGLPVKDKLDQIAGELPKVGIVCVFIVLVPFVFVWSFVGVLNWNAL
jgi:trehalose 6-phosphate synthase/phosphatase